MGSSIELGARIKTHQSELTEVANRLVEGKGDKITAALASLVLGVATGHPELSGLLSPFIEKGVRHAFASTATKRLQSELAKFAAQDDRAAFIADIATAVETLLGQALVQLVRTQQQGTDKLIEALGGMREDLRDFREAFRAQLEDADVRVDIQSVRDGATGVCISEAAARVWIGKQTVSGQGSVGIHIGRR